AADFADMGELHGERQQQAEVEVVTQPDGVRFRYRHAEIPMETRIVAEGGAAWSFADGRLYARIVLEHQATVELRLRVTAVDAREPMSDAEADAREERLRTWQRDITTIEAKGET